jgi:hypothetical protein
MQVIERQWPKDVDVSSNSEAPWSTVLLIVPLSNYT